MCTEQERIDANITKEKLWVHSKSEIMCTQGERNDVQIAINNREMKCRPKECSEGHMTTC